MSFRLRDGEGVADGIRRIVAEELDDAVAGLRDGAGATAQRRDAAIHEARKNLKKARSALRLVRTDLRGSTRRAETAAMRDAGRRLSGARDAQVMLDTLAGLARRSPAPPAGELHALEATLTKRRDELARRLAGEEGLLGAVAGELQAIRDRVPGWRLRDATPASAVEGAAIIHARGRAAMRAALRGGEDADWHEWRKRVKDLWYVGRILEPIAGPQLAGLVREADELADVLGAHNDLAVLLGAAGDHPGVAGAIVARRDELRRAAAPLGRRLYAEKPAAFGRRLRALMEAHGAAREAQARWLAPDVADAVRAQLAAKPAADEAGRRAIAAELRRLGLRATDYERLLPRHAGGFSAEDFELLVTRGVVRVGTPPDPATLGGL
jgi:CHAD domain-containing protein